MLQYRRQCFAGIATGVITRDPTGRVDQGPVDDADAVVALPAFALLENLGDHCLADQPQTNLGENEVTHRPMAPSIQVDPGIRVSRASRAPARKTRGGLRRTARPDCSCRCGYDPDGASPAARAALARPADRSAETAVAGHWPDAEARMANSVSQADRAPAVRAIRRSISRAIAGSHGAERSRYAVLRDRRESPGRDAAACGCVHPAGAAGRYRSIRRERE